MNALVTYYSRTGTTRKTAQAIADALRDAGCDNVQSEEIVETRSRKGVFGFLGAGRDATLKRTAVIEPLQADVGSFDIVAIGTPVWAFTCATPVRAFCDQHGREAKQVAFFCTMGATLALIERHVKRDDQEKFLDEVKAFAETIGGAQA